MLRLRTAFRYVLAVLLTVGVLGGVSLAAHAESTTQAVTQAYGTDSSLQKGMLVRLKDSDTSKVEPLSEDSGGTLQGVVVAANDAAVTLSPATASKAQVFVATFGRYDVLVSNQNGPIKSGDYITISSLDGVGMKANTTESTVLGKAAGSFNGSSNVISSSTLTDGTGHQVSVSIGRIPVVISISHNPLQERSAGNLPGSLAKLSEQIAGKQVSAPRVYLSLVVLAASAVVAGSLLYSGIRNGLIAIGRNPLARGTITRNMFQVILTSLIIFIIGLFAVYLLLRI